MMKELPSIEQHAKQQPGSPGSALPLPMMARKSLRKRVEQWVADRNARGKYCLPRMAVCVQFVCLFG